MVDSSSQSNYDDRLAAVEVSLRQLIDSVAARGGQDFTSSIGGSAINANTRSSSMEASRIAVVDQDNDQARMSPDDVTDGISSVSGDTDTAADRFFGKSFAKCRAKVMH